MRTELNELTHGLAAVIRDLSLNVTRAGNTHMFGNQLPTPTRKVLQASRSEKEAFTGLMD